jgi:hypothetical protein
LDLAGMTEHDHTLFSHDDLGIRSSALRELAEELSHAISRKILDKELIYRGVINDDSSDVGRRHVAVIFEYRVKDWDAWSLPQRGEASINQLEWIDVKQDKIDLNEFEYWSQMCWRAFFPSIVEAQPSYKIIRKRPFVGSHLLVVTGTIGSGKSAATEFFHDWLKYEEINSGKILASILNLSPIPRTSRRTFQAAAVKFINSKTGPRRLARKICQIANSSDAPRVVIDGIRHRETLNLIREFSTRAVAVIYVQAAPDIAYKLYLFRTVNERFGDLPHSFAGKRAYIVTTNPSDFELQLFQERRIEVIATSDLDRSRAVSDLLDELAS